MKKEKVKVKGRTAAIIGMILLIVVSIPVGSCVSLARERGKVTELYYGSDDEWGLLDDLSWCSSEASNLVTLAGKYLPEDDEQVIETRRAVDTLGKALTPAEKSEAFSALTVKLNALGNTLSGMELKEEDGKHLDEILADYNANADFIARNDYNTEAAKFNEMLRTTPARPLADLIGVGEVELFR